MVLKISPNAVGLMAATMLPRFSETDIEDMMFRSGYFMPSGRSLKDLALNRVAVLACDLAKEIEMEMESRDTK